MEWESSITRRVPIVHTTRLDQMSILGKDLSETKPKDIIEAIIFESKPQYSCTDCINERKLLKIKQEFGYVQSNRNCIQSFEELKFKLNVLISKRERSALGTEVVIKSEIDADINAKETNSPESLLSLCKPLKIVLEDINKTLPKKDEPPLKLEEIVVGDVNKTVLKLNDEIKTEVLNISSDSDDDVVIVKNDIKESTNTINDIIITTEEVPLYPTANHVIKYNSDFEKLLREVDLKDCVIVIYNLYSEILDAYQIGEYYEVVEYKTKKYTEVLQFPVKKCNLIVNILACCWKNRHCYVSLLLQYEKYNNIAKCIDNSHSCRICKCCCIIPEELNRETMNKLTERDNIAPEFYITSRGGAKAGKLISVALAYEKKSKWNGYPEQTNKIKNNLNCKRLFKFNNTNGDTEFYESGWDDSIYSKIVHKAADRTCWLYKTISQCSNGLNFTFTNSLDREKKIVTYIYMNNNISYDTECFLREPMHVKLKKVNSKINNVSTGGILDKIAEHRVRHTRSFMGASNQSKIVSIVSAIRTDPLGSFDLTESSTSPNPKLVMRKRTPRRPPPPIVNQEASRNIDLLIKDLLHRFRNVLLTINDDGKVSVALNAPLNSLSHSELQILSEILNHAQSQVDKLGLTPGTCLNPGAPMTNPMEKTSTESIDTTNSNPILTINSEISDKHTSQSLKEISNNKDNVNIKADYLSQFSTIISNKQKNYKKTFCSYLGDTTEVTPKIANVFSLSSPSLNIPSTSKDHIHRNIVTKVDKTQSVSNMNPTIVVNEKVKIAILDNNVELNRPNIPNTFSRNPFNRNDVTIKVGQIQSGSNMNPTIIVNEKGETVILDNNVELNRPNIPSTSRNPLNRNDVTSKVNQIQSGSNMNPAIIIVNEKGETVILNNNVELDRLNIPSTSGNRLDRNVKVGQIQSGSNVNPTIIMREKDETIILDNDKELNRPHKRKRQIPMQNKSNQPKIRIKTVKEFLLDESASPKNPEPSSNIGNVECDEMPMVFLTPDINNPYDPLLIPFNIKHESGNI